MDLGAVARTVRHANGREDERGVALVVQGVQVCPGRDQLPHTLCTFGAQGSGGNPGANRWFL